MYFRICIAVLLSLALHTGVFAHPPGPGVQSPQQFTRDSVHFENTSRKQRNDRLYDSIRSKTNRRTVPRMLYKVLFARPVLDTTSNGQILDENDRLARFAGKTIGSIRIDQLPVFDSVGNWLQRSANRTHRLTRERVIRRDLFLHPGESFEPELLVRNMQLLRSRPYISDVDFAVVPDPVDTSRVDLVVTARDSWTISADAGIHSEGRTMFGLSDANIFGWGNALRLRTNFDRRDFSYGGNEIEYEIPNVLGSFYTAQLAAGRAFYQSTLLLDLHKEFLRPTDYEAGASYSVLKDKRPMIEQDSSELVKERNLDLWGGYSRYLPAMRASLFLTGHYNYRRLSLRPQVAAQHHPALHDRDLLLFGIGFYREKFYTANMIYGFGRREYLAAGYKAQLTGGYSWGEFGNEIYLGASYDRGGFFSVGYVMGGCSFGSFIDPVDGTWRRSAANFNLRWFSNLFLIRRSRLRQFLGFSYTQGWNRGTGNDESIRFTFTDGLQALKEYTLGTTRAVLNTETVLFSPYQPLGFRIAFFGFADFGLIGYSPNVFKNAFYTSLGMGVRLRNERLVFKTIQIRLGIAFGKHGLVESEYFRLSNTTRLSQYRYRPERPDIIGFE